MLAFFSGYLLYELAQLLKGYLVPLTAQLYGEEGNKFLVGGTLCFKARYQGDLKNGYFTTKIRTPEFESIRDTGREHEWFADYNTYDWRTKTGTLNGSGTGSLLSSLTGQLGVIRLHSRFLLESTVSL